MSNNFRNIAQKESFSNANVGPLIVGQYRVTKTLGQGSYGKVKRKSAS
jgi:hypothetical protein